MHYLNHKPWCQRDVMWQEDVWPTGKGGRQCTLRCKDSRATAEHHRLAAVCQGDTCIHTTTVFISGIWESRVLKTGTAS